MQGTPHLPGPSAAHPALGPARGVRRAACPPCPAAHPLPPSTQSCSPSLLLPAPLKHPHCPGSWQQTGHAWSHKQTWPSARLRCCSAQRANPSSNPCPWPPPPPPPNPVTAQVMASQQQQQHPFCSPPCLHSQLSCHAVPCRPHLSRLTCQLRHARTACRSHLHPMQVMQGAVQRPWQSALARHACRSLASSSWVPDSRMQVQHGAV